MNHQPRWWSLLVTAGLSTGLALSQPLGAKQSNSFLTESMQRYGAEQSSVDQAIIEWSINGSVISGSIDDNGEFSELTVDFETGSMQLHQTTAQGVALFEYNIAMPDSRKVGWGAWHSRGVAAKTGGCSKAEESVASAYVALRRALEGACKPNCVTAIFTDRPQDGLQIQS